jgi:hypothetical protein
MTDLEKYNLLKLYLEDPSKIVDIRRDAINYSPFSID